MFTCDCHRTVSVATAAAEAVIRRPSGPVSHPRNALPGTSCQVIWIAMGFPPMVLMGKPSIDLILASSLLLALRETSRVICRFGANETAPTPLEVDTGSTAIKAVNTAILPVGSLDV